MERHSAIAETQGLAQSHLGRTQRSSGLEVQRERQNPGALGFCVDDAHLRPEHPGWNGGWIVVRAPSCTQEALLAAIRAGRFYSTCGPEFHSIECEGEVVRVRTSPVRFIRCAGPAHRGNRCGSFDSRTISEAEFTIPEDWAYARLEIEDASGKRAWTNTLFAEA